MVIKTEKDWIPQKDQAHLGYEDTVNFGSYYTPELLVSIVYEMLERNVGNLSEFTIADTSCGYGNFLRMPNSIGADYDETALENTKNNVAGLRLFHHNSLQNVSRGQYGLADRDKLIIVGNPPYNDTTSIIRNEIKRNKCETDSDLKHRDLGVSFLLSYDRLSADYVCVLHPLSYLIKKANFDSLRNFKNNYFLADSLVVSSGEFSTTSKITPFPIIIALYKRGKGMTYETVCNHVFKTKEGKRFRIGQYDKLENYATKYPNKKVDDHVANFWTMRDINALKRSKTFIEKEVCNSIRVPREKLALYCYADVFKEFIPHIPYYFGNSDIMIDYPVFEKMRDIFTKKSLRKYKFLTHLAKKHDAEDLFENLQIRSYFENLLGEHYVDK